MSWKMSPKGVVLILGSTSYFKHTYKPDVQFIEAGVTMLDHEFYYGFSTLITGQTISEHSSDFYSVSAGSSTSVFQQSSSYSTYNLFLGYSIMDNLSIYGGLTSSASNMGDRIVLDGSGPFVGVRSGYQLGVSSSLTFDLSYVSAETEITSTSSFTPDGYKANTDTKGLSYSLTWLRFLDRGRSFFVRFKVIDMDHEGSGIVTGTTVDGVVSLDASQKITSISFGMGF